MGGHPRRSRSVTRVAFVGHFLGRRLADTYEIVDLAAERLAMRTAEGTLPMETTYRWVAEGPGTRMTLRNRGEAAAFSKIAVP